MASEKTPLTANDDTLLDALTKAAWHVEDAARKFSPQDLSRKTFGDRKMYLLAESVGNPWRGVVIGLLVLLTYFELPLWCLRAAADPGSGDDDDGSGAAGSRAYSHPWSFADARCAAPDGGHIYLFGTPYLPVNVSALIECLLYGYLLLHEALTMSWQGWRKFTSSFRIARALVTLAAVLDTLVFIGVRQDHFRLAPYCRVVLIALLESVGPAVLSVFEMVPSYLAVLFIYVSFYLIQAWVMAMLLDDVLGKVPGCSARAETDDELSACDDANKGFNTIGDAVFTMMVSATNTDVPDQQAPNFAHHRGYGLIWLLSYIFINFIMLAFVLATVYSTYQESLKKRVLHLFSDQTLNLKLAYDTLMSGDIPNVPTEAKRDGLPYEVIRQLVAHLNQVAEIPYVPAEHVKYLFTTLDDNGNQSISYTEFRDLCDVVSFSYKRLRTQSWFERHYPKEWQEYGGEDLRRLHRHPAFTYAVNAVLIANAVVVLIESIRDLGNHDDHLADAWAYIEFGFSNVYMLQMALALLVEPFDVWFSKRRNQYDLVVTLLLELVSILWIIPSVPLPADTLRYFNILRLLRLFTISMAIKRVAFVVNSMAAILTGAVAIINLLFMATYIWSVIGCQAYGGLVYSGAPELADSDMFEGNYDVFNFNDMGMAFFALLPFLVTGGVITPLISGYALVTGEHRFGSTAFFFSFQYFAFFVVFNIFVSFVIDGLTMYDAVSINAVPEELQSFVELIHKHPEPGYDVVFHGRTNQDSVYRKMFEDDLNELIKAQDEKGS